MYGVQRLCADWQPGNAAAQDTLALVDMLGMGDILGWERKTCYPRWTSSMKG
jgi:hypothetical protein